MQQQLANEQFFDNLVVMGVTVASMLKGGQMAHYAYNQARKLWQSKEAQPPSPDSGNTTTEGQRSIRRAFGFEDATLTPEQPSQQEQVQQQQVQVQPQGPMIRQAIRLEVGQQFLPVNDHDDHDDHNHHDNHDDHDHKTADSSAAIVLERVHQGKRPFERQSTCLVWNNDFWQTKMQQLIQMVEQLQNQVPKLEASIVKSNTVIMNNIRTPMVKSIVTFPTPVKDCYTEVMNSNDVRKVERTDEIITIVDGTTRRPKRSPCTDSSNENGSGKVGHLGHTE